MSFSIIRADKFNTINWSGGTSTQLYIYPENADYKQKNFDFRLSTAKVEVEKSEFTPLIGVSRKIMILDGEIEISHKNHHIKRLQKFDIDEFEGSWETSSVGTCIDFNLMTRGNTKGELNSITLKKDQTVECPITRQNSKLFIYLYSGKISFKTANKNQVLNQGELLIITKFHKNTLQLTGSNDSTMIVSNLLY